MSAKDSQKPKKNLVIHLLAGGVAGFAEALTCHPLDTIKVRLQLRGERLSNRLSASSVASSTSKRQTFITTGVNIARREGVLALWKGLGAVLGGIVPKMAIRFSSFEAYKGWISKHYEGQIPAWGVFMAGLGAGVTEAVMVVTPMDVIKIRLQAQRHSMTDPLDVPKYRNAGHCAYVVIKEEGAGALYRGVGLTALRQATNQAANFSVYTTLKSYFQKKQPELETLPSYQVMLSGFISGATGPLFNAPIDTVKTRIQKNPSKERGWQRFVNVTTGIIKHEGYLAFYKGLTPRVLRVAPGQAITFMVYERVYAKMMEWTVSWRGDAVPGLPERKA